MNALIIDVTISADEYLKFYQSPGVVVSTRARDGRSVRFPAKILQPYVTRQGIRGSFRISFSAAGKFQAIDRLA